MSSERCKKSRLVGGVWRCFLDGKPEYLVRHWWAYLWHWGVWFFDHQPIINAILFGQYHTLSQRAVEDCMKDRPDGRLLQLTCAYGSMTPSLLNAMDDELYLMDVAEIQLEATREKLTDEDKKRLLSARMNAEFLAYKDDAFSTVLIFSFCMNYPQMHENAVSVRLFEFCNPAAVLLSPNMRLAQKIICFGDFGPRVSLFNG